MGLAAETGDSAKAPRPERVDLEAIRQLAYEPYRLLMRRIEDARRTDGIDEDQYRIFHDRLTTLFLKDHKPDELFEIESGHRPTPAFMRREIVRVKELISYELLPGFDVVDLRFRDQSTYTVNYGKLTGVFDYQLVSATGEKLSRVALVIDGEVQTLLEDPDPRWHSLPRGIYECDELQVVDGQPYGLVSWAAPTFGGFESQDILFGDHWENQFARWNPLRQTYDWVNPGQVVSRRYYSDVVVDPERETWSGVFHESPESPVSNTFPIIDRVIQKQLESNPGIEIESTRFASFSDGRFSGVLGFGSRSCVVVDGKEIMQIDGKACGRVDSFALSDDRSTFSGVLDLETDNWDEDFTVQRERVVIVNGNIHQMLSHDPDFFNFEVIGSSSEGVRGFVSFEEKDKTWIRLPVRQNTIVREIGGVPIRSSEGIIFSAEDRVTGFVKITAPQGTGRDWDWGVVIEDELVTEIDGRPIVGIHADVELIDNPTKLFGGKLDGLTGTIQLLGEDRRRKYVLGEWEYE